MSEQAKPPHVKNKRPWLKRATAAGLAATLGIGIGYSVNEARHSAPEISSEAASAMSNYEVDSYLGSYEIRNMGDINYDTFNEVFSHTPAGNIIVGKDEKARAVNGKSFTYFVGIKGLPEDYQGQDNETMLFGYTTDAAAGLTKVMVPGSNEDLSDPEGQALPIMEALLERNLLTQDIAQTDKDTGELKGATFVVAVNELNDESLLS